MKAGEANFLRFLHGADQLVVPLYQRRYSWTEDEWRQLWSDIVRIATVADPPDHFIGSVVQVGDIALSAGHNPLQIIDGQQRIATLSLLLLALERAAESRLQLNPDDHDAQHVREAHIRRYYLLDDAEIGDRRFKLLPNEADRSTYLSLLEGTPEPDRLATGVISAYRYFAAQIATCGLRLVEVFNAIAHLVIVEVALERGRDNPQLIFESLNSTGLDLTQADLIRNYVLMGLAPNEQDDLYRHSWHPMEERLGPVGPEGFDRFVRDYLTMRTGQIPRIDQIYRAFKEFVAFSADGLTDIAGDLHKFSGLYAKLVTGSETEPRIRAAIADVARLRVEVAYPFLLSALDDRDGETITDDDLLAVLRTIEAYVFRRAVCGVPTNALNKIFATLAREIDDERYLESFAVALLLREGSGRFPRDEEFRRELVAKDIYNFRNRGCLFDKLENAGRKERVDVAAYTVEHVMPQNPDVSPEWQEELGPD